MRPHVPSRAGLRAATALLCLVCVGACASTRSSPGDGDSMALAEAASRSGDWEEAAERWSDLYLSSGGEDVRACAETARALAELDDLRGANEILEAGLRQHPEDPELLITQGDVLSRLGFRRAAEVAYERVLTQEPHNEHALLALGRLRVELGLERAAIGPLEEVIRLDPEAGEPWLWLARAAQASGQSVKAYRAWRRAFGWTGGELDDLLAASTIWADRAVREEHPEARQACLDWLGRVVDIDPQNTRAHFQIAVIREDLGYEDEAISSYRRAAETDPGCLQALTNLAILYARRGDETRTREMVARALQLEQDRGRREALEGLLRRFDG